MTQSAQSSGPLSSERVEVEKSPEAKDDESCRRDKDLYSVQGRGLFARSKLWHNEHHASRQHHTPSLALGKSGGRLELTATTGFEFRDSR